MFAFFFNMWAVIWALSIFCTSASAYNIDARASYVLEEPGSSSSGRESYFGYSVALYADSEKSWALIGAPRANTSLWTWAPEVIPEPGSLYACPLHDPAHISCKQILVDPTGNGLGPDSSQYMDLKNHGWLGGVLDLLQEENYALITTCSHRWKNQFFSNDDYYINGACYWADAKELIESNFESRKWQKILPLIQHDKQRIFDSEEKNAIYFYQLGQAGTSVHIMKNGAGVLMGAPGVRLWAGTVATLKESDDWGVIESRGFLPRGSSHWVSTTTSVMTPGHQVNFYDYFGSSVSYGRFWGDKDSMVAGAPRADLYGKVYIFKTSATDSMEVEWASPGPQVGSGYGWVVASGDVTGDTWDELLVGAPFYSHKIASMGRNLDVWEAGAVVVYGRDVGAGSTGLKVKAFLRGSPIERGARFGSSLSILGDLDLDGFNDVAVGAPYEAEGRGAVYIYNGGAGGLTLTQKVMASDVSTSLRGFGIAFSRGTDSDDNGYLDVCVGSYLSSGAVVLRTRGVARLLATIKISPAILTQTGGTFIADVCIEYHGQHIQNSANIEVLLVVDDGKTSARAIFTQNGLAQLQEEVTVKKDNKMCMTYALRLKDDITDFSRPLDMTFHYSSADFSQERPWCRECAIVAHDSPTMVKTSLPLAIGCGTDAVCRPSIQLVPSWTSGLNEEGRYIVGSNKVLTLQSTVESRGEPAYLTWVMIHLPPGLLPKSLPYTCTIAGDTSHQVKCTLPSPLPLMETVDLLLQEEGELMGDKVEVVIEMGASGADTIEVTLDLFLRRDIRLDLNGHASMERVYYDPNSTTPLVNTEVIFQIQNFGVTGGEEVVLNVGVPVAYTSPQGNNLTFGVLTQASVFPDSGVNRCKLVEEETSIMDVDMIEDDKFPPLETTLTITCGLPGVVCGRVTCTLSGLRDSPTVKLYTRYNLTHVIDWYGKNVSSTVQTWARLTSHQDEYRNDAGVWVAVVPIGWVPPSIPPREAPFWVYFVSVLSGILLLVLLVLGLYKLGFFTRHRPTESNSKRDSNGDAETREGDAYEDEERAITEVDRECEENTSQCFDPML